MPRKIDDRLLSQIFDEGASGNPGAEWLRDSLKGLKDVPAHGLSNERLRDRLLATNLAPTKPASAPWWTWAWAPVTAAVLAVVIVPRLRPAETPTVILNSDRVATTSVPAPGLRTPNIVMSDTRAHLDALVRESELAILEGMAENPTQPVVPVARLVISEAPSRPRVRRTVPRVRTNRTAPVENARIVTKSSPPPVPTITADTPGTARTQEVAFAPMPTTSREELTVRRDLPNDPLVLLGSEIDADTGAASATEIDSPANLSIGG